MTKPVLSVIIPTCHRNDQLARTLGALSPRVQNLSPDHYEVIVSDDGRRSTAEEMIRTRFPSVKWIRGPRNGPAGNRNNGARIATTDWLVFTDDDCLPEPGWIIAYATAIASGRASVYEGRTYSEPHTRGPFWEAPSNENGGLLWSCNLAIRRDLFATLGGFDDRFPYPHLEDVDFRERLKSAGHAFVFCRDAAVFHPLRPVASVTRQAMGHESYFYYSAKHGLSLVQSGLSVQTYVRARLIWGRRSRGLADAVCFAARSAAEALLVTAMSPWWLLKFRLHRKPF